MVNFVLTWRCHDDVPKTGEDTTLRATIPPGVNSD